MGLQISVRESDDVTIVRLQGRSTINGESELLSDRLRALTAKGNRKLLLDLAKLTQVDSTGVSVIIDVFLSLQRQGGELKLLRPQGRVLEVLTLFRLLEMIPHFSDEAQAVGSFHPRDSLASFTA